MSGRWQFAGRPDGLDPLLVVQLHGRRHRFASDPDAGDASPPGTWITSFTIPAWAEPSRHGQAALWMGHLVVAVPPPGAMASDSPPPIAAALTTPEPIPASDSGRGGPLTDLLLKETVSTLRAELEQRAGEAARLRGALEQSETERAEIQRRLTAMAAAHDVQAAEVAAVRGQRDSEIGGLRDELAQTAATARAHAEASASLRVALETVCVARDAAISESAGLRGELARLGTELAVTREQAAAQGGDFGEAQQLLADARALTEQFREG